LLLETQVLGQTVRVGIIDAKADQILTQLQAANSIAVGYGVTQAISAVLPGAGTTQSWMDT
jgi:hypothetical protein